MEEQTKKSIRILIASLLTVVFAVAGFGIGYFLLPPKAAEEVLPLTTAEPLEVEKETEVPVPVETVEEEPTVYEKTPLMKGIDVSKWQGKPNWTEIAADGVEFAMIRIGFHGTGGAIGEDSSADYNLKNADENGILTGIYFYSLASSEEEAIEEAAWVLERAGKYAISLPIVIDYEMADNDGTLTAAVRTKIALAFLDTVAGAGYEAMIYVPIEEWEDPALWEQEEILKRYMVWGADYEAPVYPEKEHPDGVSNFAMWQYSNTGKVAGINGNVDLNLAYFTAERKEAKFPEKLKAEEIAKLPAEAFDQNFVPADRFVTAKIEVNLRKAPSTDGKIVATLKNGEYLYCTGDGSKGWSRVHYEGQTLYAVSSYLLDERGKSFATEENFTQVSQKVTAKELVNLRLSPSKDGEIAGQLKHGDYLERTGIGDRGWSRLHFQGKTVYAVTSYLEE